MKNKNCICIIPARGGSKRIKNKNIKFVNKIPMIGHVIKSVKQTKIFKKIIVSTDNKKIKKISESFGAEVPYLRKKNLSDDFTGTDKVLKFEIKKNNLQNFSYLICIYPTAIFLKKKDLINALKKIKKLNVDKLISVKEFESFTMRGYFIEKKILKKISERFHRLRSQDIRKVYFDPGYFYIFKIKEFLIKKNLKSTFYVLNKYSNFDINDMDDLRYIKKNYKVLKKM